MVKGGTGRGSTYLECGKREDRLSEDAKPGVGLVHHAQD